jgi:peroxiredoxin
MNRNKLTWVFILVVLGWVLLPGGRSASFAGKAEGQRGASKSTKDNRGAADFTLKDTEGKSFQLSSYKGKQAVLLYFWTTWCPYCRQSEPKIKALRNKYSLEDLEILAINSGESVEKTKRYQESRKLPYHVLHDAKEAVSGKYGVEGVPLFVLVSKDGRVVYRDHVLPDAGEIKGLVAVSATPAAKNPTGQPESQVIVSQLSDEAMEQILEGMGMEYLQLNEAVYYFPETKVALANHGENLEVIALYPVEDAAQSRIEEWNKTHECAQASVFEDSVYIGSELILAEGVPEAKIVEFIKSFGSLAKRFQAHLEANQEMVARSEGREGY